jgi:hypothetical protein
MNAANKNVEYVYIQYRFMLQNGRELTFRLRLDPRTYEAVEATPGSPPAWTRLSFHQCPNCTLEGSLHPHCPAALRLAPLVAGSAGLPVYMPAHVEVTLPERTVSAHRPLQKGLTSLLGLIMATSGCPHTARLRPMARFHLPFATDDETLYRATSMYLLAQYFLHKEGRKPDLELDGLGEIYRHLQTVNTAMGKRLEAAGTEDTAARAIVPLDLFSHLLPFDIKTSLDHLQRLFEPYRSA